ncbi:MAG: AraC family transcriptional regulator [Clostridia bacterium]|nr:AraC family transcriptional regulator [Clostridia bacterium]
MKEPYFEPKNLKNGRIPKIIAHSQKANGITVCCPAHYHSYIELIYCLCGKFKTWANNNQYYIFPGDLIVINSNDVHAIQSVSEEGGEYIVLRFEPEILYESSHDIFEAKYTLPFIINNSSTQKVFPYSEIYSTDIPKLMHNALSEYENADYGYELALRSDICRIFVWILRFWSRNGIQFTEGTSISSEHIKAMQTVLEYIAGHYSEEISAESMAELANMSYSYFSRIFKQVMNKSFNDYLNYVRIIEAEKLLASTDKSITEIAYETGFSSSSYFIKIFDKYKGMPPGNFRKKFNIKFGMKNA